MGTTTLGRKDSENEHGSQPHSHAGHRFSLKRAFPSKMGLDQNGHGAPQELRKGKVADNGWARREPLEAVWCLWRKGSRFPLERPSCRERWETPLPWGFF